MALSLMFCWEKLVTWLRPGSKGGEECPRRAVMGMGAQSGYLDTGGVKNEAIDVVSLTHSTASSLVAA